MTAQPRIYNPALLSKDELKDTFVARKETLDELIDHIAKHRPGEPCRHLIIVGSRGMGKTTLGLRVLYEVEDNPALSDTWQPIPFSEESYGITDAADLWLTALNHLSHAVDDDTWAEYSRKISESESDALRLEAYALDALNEYCEEANRRVILFIENVDHMFEQFKSKREIHAIRAAIMTNPKLLIVGTANSVFAGIQKYSEPFYGFFQLFHLEGLGRREAAQLVETITKRPNNGDCEADSLLAQGRVEAVRRLTGGNPRSIVMAAQMLVEAPSKRADVLERLIDEQTPYFKTRIEELPVQARKVFNQLAEGWRPMLAREVAVKTRLGTSQTSAQLRVLIDRGYAREVNLAGESRTRYELCDRFFNIYHLFRLSRAKRERLRWFVEFLYELFGPSSIRHVYLNALKALGPAQYTSPEIGELLSTIVRHVVRNVEPSDQERYISEILRAADENDEHLNGGGDNRRTSDWIQLGERLQNSDRIGDAIWVYNHAIYLVFRRPDQNNGPKEHEYESMKDWVELEEFEQQLVKEVSHRITQGIDVDHLSMFQQLMVASLNGIIGIGAAIAREDTLAENSLRGALKCPSINEYNSENERQLIATLLFILFEMVQINPELGNGNELEEVIERLAKMRRSDGELLDGYVFMGVVSVASRMIISQRYDLLKTLCLWATKEFPERHEGWRLYAGWAFSQTYDEWYMDAKKFVENALAIAPNNAGNHHIAFLVEAKRGRWNNGFKHLETVFELDPEFGMGHWSMYSDLFVQAAGAGEQGKVVQIMENANLKNELEPLWYALHPEENLDAMPLPREIVDTAKHIRTKLNNETGNER